jgi:hypothetical protein
MSFSLSPAELRRILSPFLDALLARLPDIGKMRPGRQTEFPVTRLGPKSADRLIG